MNPAEIEQGTDAWRMVRLGKVTASRIADLMAKTKSGYSASRDSYMAQLTIERLTQKPTEGYTNAAMAWGVDQEPFARAAYETKTGQLVTEVGFIVHPEIDQAGASPDGLVGDEGMVEIKCPESKTMIETLLSDKVPDKYFKQMQWQMACTGRNWCDYVVFDPRMPENLQLCVRRVERDDYIIDEIKAEIKKFLAELDQQIGKLRAL
jgi:putative phage-type endonuclease